MSNDHVPLSVEAIGRIPVNYKVLVIYLNRKPTDSEVLAIHDALWKIVNEG